MVMVQYRYRLKRPLAKYLSYYRSMFQNARDVSQETYSRAYVLVYTRHPLRVAAFGNDPFVKEDGCVA